MKNDTGRGRCNPSFFWAKQPVPEVVELATGLLRTSRNMQNSVQTTANPDRVTEFMHLFTAHQLRLRAFACSLIPHWADAEEVLQQANVIIWRKFDEFQSGTNFFSWASKIVYFTAKDFRKRQRLERRIFSDEFLDVVADEIADSASELDDREPLLSDCVGLLKEKHRQMLRLRYYEGLTTAQVAETVGLKTRTIYKALERIHKALFDCVGRKLTARGLP
jgi:RNA polymerase sigma-70 factor, ECF subfamily